MIHSLQGNGRKMLLTRMILVNEHDEEGVGTPTLACHTWLIFKLQPNPTLFLSTTTTSLLMSLLWIIHTNNPFHSSTNCLGSFLAVIPPHFVLFTAVNLAQLLGSLLQFNPVAFNVFLSAYNQSTFSITVWDHLKQIWCVRSVCNSWQPWFL